MYVHGYISIYVSLMYMGMFVCMHMRIRVRAYVCMQGKRVASSFYLLLECQGHSLHDVNGQFYCNCS